MIGVKCPYCRKDILDIEPYIAADKVYHRWCWDKIQKVKKLVKIAYGK